MDIYSAQYHLTQSLMEEGGGGGADMVCLCHSSKWGCVEKP